MSKHLPTVGMTREDEDGWFIILERHDDVDDGPVFVVEDRYGNEDVVEAAKIGTGWEEVA